MRALPRAALAHERGAILASYVEKSDVLAQVFLQTGTFGYVPGEPSASTQPLYGWFLIAVYWIAGRHWWSLGTAQIAVAVGTALLVYEIGRRFLSRRAGLLAADRDAQPYLVWHDVHGNREILDQLLGAAMFCSPLPPATAAAVVRRALGVVSGVAVLSNSRLLLLPLALAAYLLWRHAARVAAVAVPARSARARAVGRAQQDRGRLHGLPLFRLQGNAIRGNDRRAVGAVRRKRRGERRQPSRPHAELLDQFLRRLWERAWEPGMLELMRVVKVESARFPESGRLLCQQLGERWRRMYGTILVAGMKNGEFRQMDVDVAARAISYALLGVAEKVSAFRSYDPRMPEREAMWQAVREMVGRFVLVELPRETRQGEFE